jgi:MFS family permease
MKLVPALTPNLRRAVVAFGLWSFGYNMIAPLLPLLAGQVGATPVEVGLVATASLAGAGALTLPLSYASDRLGRKSALTVAWLLSGMGILFLALAHSVQALLPGALLSGAVMGALPTLNVLVREESKPEERLGRYLAFYAASPAGALLGAWLGGLAAQSLGLGMACVLSGAVVLASTSALVTLRHEDPGRRPSREPVRHAPRRRALVFFALAAGVGYLLLALPSHFLLLYLHTVRGQDFASTGLLASLLGLSQLLWSLLLLGLPLDPRPVRIPRLDLTLSRGTLFGLAVALAANVAYGLLVPLDSVLAWVLAILLRGSFYTIQPLGFTAFSETLTGERWATLSMTSLTLPLGLGAAVAPVVGGFAYARAPVDPFLVTAASSAFAAVLLVPLLLRAEVPSRVETVPETPR